jgi:hypothetical protein
MALFSVKVDTRALDSLSDRLAHLTPEQIGALMVDAINETVDSAYELSRKTILKGINLTDGYVQQKMQVEHATPKNPTATITAFGGSKYTTSLSHYGAMQNTKAVTWNNTRIQALKNFTGFSKWPGWTRRTGNAPLGVAADQKVAGKSVEVVRGQRKQMGPIFSIPGKKDSEGNLLLFRNQEALGPVKGGKLKVLEGPSVYQLFRTAATSIHDQVEGDLEKSVVDAAERELTKALT